jgi:hypothetical protein
MSALDVQGCQHWGLSAMQQKQEQYARRLRKAVLFEGADTLARLLAGIRADLGPDSVSLCCRLGNSNGKCALHMAAWRGDTAAVTQLLGLGAKVNAITIRGQTALHFAVGKRRDDVVVLLLEKGAKTRIRTVKGETPVSLAHKCRLAEHVQARLVDAEAAEEEWVDFEGFYRARAHRRLIMEQLGTIIYSAGGLPEEEEEEQEEASADEKDGPLCPASSKDRAGKEEEGDRESGLVMLFVGGDGPAGGRQGEAGGQGGAGAGAGAGGAGAGAGAGGVCLGETDRVIFKFPQEVSSSASTDSEFWETDRGRRIFVRLLGLAKWALKTVKLFSSLVTN